MTKKEAWNSYYKRAQKLPSIEFYQWFLDRVPQHGCVLDVGAGTGRFITAFKKDRPDLIIDALDNQPESLKYLHQNNSVNHVYDTSFDILVTTQPYHAIWALNSLFFMEQNMLIKILQTLYDALLPNGFMMFTYLKDNPETNNYKKLMARISKVTLLQILEDMNFHLESLEETVRPFGKEQIQLPVFKVIVTKSS